MKINKAYKGREHSWIKHELLKAYLEVLLSISSISGVKEVTYVDCFAGPWGNDSNSLEGTSIAISLDILAKVRETLATRHGVHGLKFRAIYVEKKRSRYKRLSEYLENNTPDGIEAYPLPGDYWDQQDEILRLCGQKSFSFFFVDPKGWTDVGIPKLSKLLSRPRSEFLITFMSSFLNRFVKVTELRQQVSEMLGDMSEKDYQKISSLTPRERERFIVSRYREQLKIAFRIDGACPPRLYHANVLHKDKNMVHYHLVYLTRHHKGIVEFAEASEKVELFQRVVRIQKKQDQEPQMGLFSAEKEAECQNGYRADISDVKGYWLNELSSEPKRFGEAELASMLEETGWLIGDFETAFIGLLNEGQVENLDVVGKRPKHPIHFRNCERLRRIE